MKHKNEHVVPRKIGWAVRREGGEKISKLFATQSEAMDYAGRIALKDGVSMVVHKHNGEFKNFRHGYEIHIKVRKIKAPLFQVTENIELISFPNTEPLLASV